MKKQLLIAAVAATMTSAAMADISLTGDATFEVKQSSGAGAITKSEVNLGVTGTSGDNSVVVNSTVIMASDVAEMLDAGEVLGDADAGVFAIEEAYVKTKIEGLSATIGLKDGRKGTSLVSGLTAKNKIVLSTKVAGVKVAIKQVGGADAKESNAKVDVSGTFGGANVAVKDIMNDGRYVIVSADVAGISVNVESGDNSDKETETAYSLSKDFGGISATYASIDAGYNDNADQDNLFGNIAGDKDISGVVVKTSTAAGNVAVKRWDATDAETNVDSTTTKLTLKRGNVVYSYTDTDTDGTDTDAVFGAKVKFSF